MEPLDWLQELEELKFAVSSLAEFHPPGSYARENATNAARGIRARIQWVIEQAKAEVKRERRT